MFLLRTDTRFITIVSIGLTLLATPSLAREMVSIKGSVVNLRSKPSMTSAILWELERGYPLQVLRRQGSWVRVSDFENDKGWMSKRLLWGW